MATTATPLRRISTSLKTIAWWEIGIGAFCLLAPLVASVAINLAIGLAVALVGGLLFLGAWAEPKGTKGRGWRLVEGAAIALLGLYFVVVPLAGLTLLTLILACSFFVAGLFRLLTAFDVRPLPGWGMLAVAGVAAVLCGAWLLLDLPSSRFWGPGTLLGIALLSGGIARLALAGVIGRKAG